MEPYVFSVKLLLCSLSSSLSNSLYSVSNCVTSSLSSSNYRISSSSYSSSS